MNLPDVLHRSLAALAILLVLPAAEATQRPVNRAFATRSPAREVGMERATPASPAA